MRRIVSVLLALILCITCSFACAERKTVKKDQFYLGAMRVVRCRDYVSLRATPDKTGKVLAKVPLGAIVLYCSNNVNKYANSAYKKQRELFIRCEYEGQEGYILKKYLEPAPEYEPAETKQNNDLMYWDDIIGNGEIILEWREFNVSVLGAYEKIPEGDSIWETVRVGCFIDDDPIWGYTEAVKQTGQYVSLRAFMGGTEDEPQVYVYDQAYGLIMLDLMDGIEAWTILKNNCSLGDAAVTAVSPQTGILYVTGTDGPDPVAISMEGNILWKSVIDDPEVYEPTEIKLNPNDIQVFYDSGKTVMLEYNGEVISITDTK